MSIYTYETMKEMYLKEKERKQKEQEEKEKEKLNKLMEIFEAQVLEAVKEGRNICTIYTNRLKDGKKPAIHTKNVDTYINKLKEIFPDVHIGKCIRRYTHTETIDIGDIEQVESIELFWEKFDSTA